MVKRYGSLARAQQFARLFLLPGVYHCAGGPGADRVDWLGAIRAWTERGQAPTSVLASKVSGGVTKRNVRCTSTRCRPPTTAAVIRTRWPTGSRCSAHAAGADRILSGPAHLARARSGSVPRLGEEAQVLHPVERVSVGAGPARRVTGHRAVAAGHRRRSNQLPWSCTPALRIGALRINISKVARDRGFGMGWRAGIARIACW
ncbi:tannase/feruloyl esterase family alpha/beta hydrolase [Micromonospora sp. U21]|nr:tannase/feruloyl esterase family alpha/beta hydrolase [Micromonospora sp. U21]